MADTFRPLLDPFRPIPIERAGTQPGVAGTRLAQRQRRAEIRAATRKLLAEQGCEAVTVREIARTSGFALQTIYNLAGPRDQAITDAISEYSLYVGRLASRDGVPSLLALVDMWIEGAEASPAFARQCNLLIFGPSREIYYRFREIQIRGVTKLLRLQRERGRSFSNASPRRTAEQLVFFSTALWVDWADRPFPVALLREKLASGLVKLMRD